MIECALTQMATEQVLSRALLHPGPYLPRVLQPMFPVMEEGRGENDFFLGPNILEQPLKFYCAFESPKDLVKMQILTP